MAKVKPRKAAGKPPITRHPLFPATVALWFGALFGIGSLAIRPTLIEHLIVSTGLDVVIPAAAPPLGAITRILLALAMAAIGGTLGASLARRMSRPKAAPVQRKRGAPAADARNGSTVRGARRGNLASADESKPRRDYVDHAPLPGGGSILDVSQFDLDGFEAPDLDTADENQTVPIEEPDLSVDTEDWIERSRIPQGAQVFQPAATGQPEDPEPEVLDEAELANPIEEAPAVFATAPEASVEASEADFPSDMTGTVDDFFAEPAPLAEAQDLSEPGPFSAPASADGDRAPFAPPAAAERLAEQADAPQAAEVALPSFVEETGAQANEPVAIAEEHDSEPAPLARLGDKAEGRFDPLPPKIRPGSIFDKQPAAGLFTRPLNAQVSHVEWDKGADAEPALDAHDTAASDPAPAPEPRAEAAAPASPERMEPIDAAPSQRIAEAPLDDLSPVELLERLALAMRHKQELAQASQAPEPEPASATFDTVLPEPAPGPQDVAPEATLTPPVPTVPDALRPIGLDEDDDSDLLPAFIPPRHFGQSGQDKGATLSATPEAGEHPAPDAPANSAEDQEPAVGDELEQGYSSLLSLSRPGTGQQRFVRIEEPELHSADIEPVVIFPGKEPVSGDGPFSRPGSKVDGPIAQPQADPAPANEETVQRLPSASPATRLDPDETDRALRTALANLQRMSGAA